MFIKFLKLFIVVSASLLFWHISAASAATNVFYSVGQNTSDHKTGSTTVTITQSGGKAIATFSVPQTARNLGVGDIVTYGGTSGRAFLSAKITTSKWNVITATGTLPVATTSATVVGIKHAFSSLNAAVGGATPGAAGATFLTTADLTTTGYVLNIPLYYDTGPDTTAPAYGTYYRNATLKFVNTTQNDFHLAASSSPSYFGANLTNDANLPFSTDIDGQAR